MIDSPIQQAVQRLRAHAEIETTPDADLLAAFVASRCETAFAELVRRHGSMVWGVCARMVPNRHDAEDCYQATFVVLMRKAGTVQPGSRVGAWLHGVACNTSLRARALAARRGKREKQVDPIPESVTVPKSASDLAVWLDRELGALPEKYRLPIVLCELEGQGIREAALTLGCPVGTLAGRLSRGRDLLARRLSKHGLPLSATMLTAVLANQANAAVPPIALPATSAVSALAHAVMQSLILTKVMRSAAIILAAMCLLGTGLGGWFYVAPPNAIVAPPEPPIPVAAEQIRENPVADPIAWGAPVDGVRYGVAFSETRRAYRLGEKVTFVISAKNVTKETVKIEQANLTIVVSAANGKIGVTAPTVVDAKGNQVKVIFVVLPGPPNIGVVKTLELKPQETIALGEVTYPVAAELTMPGIIVGPGAYKVSFDTVCWASAKKRPTGTLELIVVDAVAWGKAVDGVQYGFAIKENRVRFKVGETVTFVIKANNVSGRPVTIKQTGITGVGSIVPGGSGATVPTVFDSTGKRMLVQPLILAGIPAQGVVREFNLTDKPAILGEVAYSIGRAGNLPFMDVGPGTYRVLFDTVCYLKGNTRPTGSIEITVDPKKATMMELFNKLKPGMTRAEVEAVVGPPVFKPMQQPTGELDAGYLGSEYRESFREPYETTSLATGISVRYVNGAVSKLSYNPKWIKK